MTSIRSAAGLATAVFVVLTSISTAQVYPPRHTQRALWYVQPGGLDIHASGRFGTSELAATVEARGYRSLQISSNVMPLSHQLVRSYDLIVLSGLNSKAADRPYLCPEEQDALVCFVRRGGRLWIIGDADDEDRRWCNSASDPFGITFVRDWGDCGLRVPFPVSHPVSDGVSSIGIVGGGGFAVRSPARALASPAQDPSIALVGCSELGAGRVVVMGDEMTFYDATRGSCGVDLSDANAVVLLDNLLTWLGETHRQTDGGGGAAALSAERIVPSLGSPLPGTTVAPDQVPQLNWDHNSYLALYPFLIDSVSYEVEILQPGSRSLQRFSVGRSTRWSPTHAEWRRLSRGEELRWRVRATAAEIDVCSFEGRLRQAKDR